jgi:hypothetical protein
VLAIQAGRRRRIYVSELLPREEEIKNQHLKQQKSLMQQHEASEKETKVPLTFKARQSYGKSII